MTDANVDALILYSTLHFLGPEKCTNQQFCTITGIFRFRKKKPNHFEPGVFEAWKKSTLMKRTIELLFVKSRFRCHQLKLER